MSGLGTLVPQGPGCVFYATVSSLLKSAYSMVVCWSSDVVSRTHTHTNTHHIKTHSTLKGQ